MVPMIELQDELAWRLVNFCDLVEPDQHSNTFEGKLREPCAGYVGENSGSAMVLRGNQTG